MKTENEIIALKLEERQKLWVELKAVPTNDKDYANSKAIVELIEATDDWEAPVQGDVLAADNCIVDGKPVKKGETVKVYEWQFNALRRFLKQPKVAAAAKAALLLFAFLLAFGGTARAQTQATVLGTPGQYVVYSIAGLNGGTNNITGTNSTFGAAVISTNTAVVPNWTSNNGVWTNAPTTNIVSIVTNTPGTISLVNYDLADVFWGFALTGAGTSTATLSADYSPDNVNWQVGAYTASLAANGTTFVGTNISLSAFAPGYWRLNTVAYPSTAVIQTNEVVEVALKARRLGP